MKLVEMLESVQATLDRAVKGEKVTTKEMSLSAVRLESVISRIKQEKHYIRVPFFEQFPLLGEAYFPPAQDTPSDQD